MKFLIFCLSSIFFLSQSVQALTLKEKFQEATEGSYICFEHQNMLSCLIFHSIDGNHLYLYEISAPKESLIKNNSLKHLLLEKKFNATSTVLYAINLQSDSIETCFSFTRNSYISITDQSNFLPKLMNLELSILPDSKRKHITPKAGNVSKVTSVWNPPKIFEGVIVKDRDFVVMKTSWQKDSSELSGKDICLYFDNTNGKFPFPYWIEIGDGALSIKLRAKDSGVFEKLPFKFFPKKPIEVAKIDKKDGLSIHLTGAEKHQVFQVVATAYQNETYETESFSTGVTHKDGITTLSFSKKDLLEKLKPGLCYQVYLFPIDDPKETIELKAILKL